MAKSKKQLFKDMIFIEEHSEYVYEGDYTYNSLHSFVAEHLEEAQDNQCDYYEDYDDETHSETVQWLYREQQNFFDI